MLNFQAVRDITQIIGKLLFFLENSEKFLGFLYKYGTSCGIMLSEKYITEEGVLNEKLALFKLLSYMRSVYQIPPKIETLTDKRKRRTIPLLNIVMPTLLFLMSQYRSFHTIFSAPESMGKRLRNCIRGGENSKSRCSKGASNPARQNIFTEVLYA